MAELRDAEVTIVGGGAIGCAVAYCLARAGYRDVQILEHGELAAATSGQAAGLVGQVRSSQERTRLAMASVAMYSRIEQETGYPADWRQTGSIRIAMTGERVQEFRMMAGVAAAAGLDVEFLAPGQLAGLVPPDLRQGRGKRHPVRRLGSGWAQPRPWRGGRRAAAGRLSRLGGPLRFCH